MKKTLLLAAALLSLYSCSKPEGKEDDQTAGTGKIDIGNELKAVYLLNEGSWGGNSASLTYIKKAERVNDYFMKQNGRRLGDVANDMKLYGGRLYIVVNNSNTIEIVDAVSGKSLRQISCDNAQPRRIAFNENYAYVTCYNGSILKIDTASMQIAASIQVSGSNPDGIAVCGGKLYAGNTGGMNFPNYDSTLSVIDLDRFEEETKVTIGINPGQLTPAGNGKILAAVTGNYEDVRPCLKIFDTKTNTVEKTIQIQCAGFDIYNQNVYCYGYDYFTRQAAFAKYDITSGRLDTAPLLKGKEKIKIPYGLAVNPLNGDLYLMDAEDMVSGVNGTLYCFDKNGNLKYSFEAGILPSKAVFVK